MKTLETIIKDCAKEYSADYADTLVGTIEEAFIAGANADRKALSEIGIDGAKTINVGEPTDNPLLSQFISYTQTAPAAAQILQLKSKIERYVQEIIPSKNDRILQLEADNKRLSKNLEISLDYLSKFLEIGENSFLENEIRHFIKEAKGKGEG